MEIGESSDAKPLAARICDYCSGEFARPVGRGRPPKYCSEDCSKAMAKERAAGKRESVPVDEAGATTLD